MVYFYSIDTYDLKTTKTVFNIYFKSKTKHVDYLFIGSSRVPATINPTIFIKDEPGKIAVVAGRGFTDAGFHYQALRNRISDFPDYIKGAVVFIEYPGSKVWDNPFYKDQFYVYEPVLADGEAMPHLLLPHLKFSSLIEFFNKSQNSFSVKVEMAILYFSSAYRCSYFINHKLSWLDSPLIKTSQDKLASEGGIRNDNIDLARQNAISVAAMDAEILIKSPILTFESLSNSSLAYFYNMIIMNGGKLVLYKMPLSSVQEQIFNTDKERINQKIFENWLEIKGIEVIYNEKFESNDLDFPDTWHLSKSRRDEFTLLLYEKFIALKNNQFTN